MSRFLLIKSWGYSIWEDVDHVVGQLLVAELTNRIPVVHWGMDSLYSESISSNSFELFFEPISNYTVKDVILPNHTYFPPVWTYENVLVEDADKLKWKNRDLNSMMNSDANVLVSDVYYHVSSIIPWIKEGHPAYGKTPHQVYRYLFDKYIKFNPEIIKEAKQFIHTHPDFRDEKPILGVHIRSNALVNEIGQIYNLNNNYHPVIWNFMHSYQCRHIFLMTDSKKYVTEFGKLYGKYDKLIPSDSKKTFLKGRVHPNRSNYPNKRHKGIELEIDTREIIKDTYLALQCDYFIGNGYSSLSNTVLRMKDWSESNIKLLY
ncbi:O-fucosyltransferase family protein [Niallia sp. 01092]|uniref:O-fucosyltransferase family protein n=1 Tax=unclassified Niallia TaxID=2837522 RepID=UPI003FD64596